MQLKVLSVTRTQNLGSNINGKEFVLHKPLKCENIMKLKDSFILWYKYIKFLRISTYALLFYNFFQNCIVPSNNYSVIKISAILFVHGLYKCDLYCLFSIRMYFERVLKNKVLIFR